MIVIYGFRFRAGFVSWLVVFIMGVMTFYFIFFNSIPFFSLKSTLCLQLNNVSGV
jgi:hypothetical protein